MKTKNKFSVKTYTNPSGDKVFRVQGQMPDGKRIRENYKSQAEAFTRSAELEIKALNGVSTYGFKHTRLTDQQLTEAEGAFQRLKGRSLLEAIDFFLQHGKQPLTGVTTERAGKDFLAFKEAQQRRPDTVKELTSVIKRLTKFLGKKQVSEITPDDLEPIILQSGLKPRTQKHRRTKIGQFFNWCIIKRFCLHNPALAIQPPTVDDGEPEIFSLPEIRNILSAARQHKGGKMVPYFALGVFAGLRPTELRRVDWSAIDLNQKIIRIEGKMAKRRKRRIVEISDNLVTWLMPHVGSPITAANWRKDLDAVRRLAGFKGSLKKASDEKRKPWIYDGLRHTALSHHFAFGDDENATAKWAGNSPDILHDKYKGLVSKKEAEEFWTIAPDNVDGEIVQLPGATSEPCIAAVA